MSAYYYSDNETQLIARIIRSSALGREGCFVTVGELGANVPKAAERDRTANCTPFARCVIVKLVVVVNQLDALSTIRRQLRAKIFSLAVSAVNQYGLVYLCDLF